MPGLCRVVTLEEIEAKDASLTPGRYVGAALSNVDDDIQFEERMVEIQTELDDLNSVSQDLSIKIRENLKEILL